MVDWKSILAGGVKEYTDYEKDMALIQKEIEEDLGLLADFICALKDIAGGSYDKNQMIEIANKVLKKMDGKSEVNE